MKKIFACTLLALFLFSSAALAGDGLPMTLAGITLGDDIKNYASCCPVAPPAPSPDAPFLDVVTLKPDFVSGVRGGSLEFANCNEVGKVARIKLKFHNRGQDLFNKLLVKYKDVYGKPDNYKGDAFKNVIAWEWKFVEGDKKVDILLMWSRDKEIRPGVSIKMTYASLLDKEYDCFKRKMNMEVTGKGGPSKIKDLNLFVPK